MMTDAEIAAAGWHTLITPAGGSFALVGVAVIPAGVYQGWSSVYLGDLTTTAAEVSVFYADEQTLLAGLFERFALYADAQLSPELFPRPASSYRYVDPVPNLLVPRVVPAVVDLVTTMLRVTPVRPAWQ
jgi:hypothetical protein